MSACTEVTRTEYAARDASREGSYMTSAGVPPPLVLVLIEGWRDLAFVAGADDEAEDDGDSHRYGEPRDNQPENPVHIPNNDLSLLLVTDE